MAEEDEDIRSEEDLESGEGGPLKSFLDHLEDLRWVFIKSALALVVGMLVCLFAAPKIITILTWPKEQSGVDIKLEMFGPVGGFMISMKLAFYTGLVIGLPFILYFIGQFVIPALKKKEKKYFYTAFGIGTSFFMAGVLICYFYILPLSIRGLNQYNIWLGIPTQIWRAEEYFEFVTKFILGVGLLFELPVLILTLVRLGIIKHHVLAKGRKFMFVVNLVFCAVITPADMVTTVVMALILQIMFEGCLFISNQWEKKKVAAEKAAAENPQD
jgi:sec-independent protein translocase protein TatC